MRRVIVLLFLYVGMQLLLPFGQQGQGSQALLAFGFIILAAYTTGELATAIRIPKIVGYMIAGLVFGPELLGAVSTDAADRLEPVNQLAIALIAFLAGAELRWEDVRDRGIGLLKITGVELAFSFVAIGALLYIARPMIPPLEGASPALVFSFILLFASIAIVHSPAVTMALLSETGARGPVARTTLGVVLIADVVVVLLFSGALTVARVLAPPTGAAGPSLGLIVWEILGALVVGAALGAGVAAYLRFVGRELILFAILVAFFGLELVRIAHVELLLTLLTAGFVAENISARGDELREAMERSSAPIFVVFFALAGAKIQLSTVAPLLPLVIPLALIRAGAIMFGTRVGGRWAGVSAEERKYVWQGLVPQAGVAIGLAAIVAEAYGEVGVSLRGLMLALIAINQVAGPILARRALVSAGEIEENGAAEAATPAPAPT